MGGADGRTYWPGNAAKSRVIRHLLEAGTRSILDHGCGNGGAWPAILSAHPDLELMAWDPDAAALAEARRRLASCNARVVAELPEGTRADAIVSFSVLEHVRDRRAYLAQAKRHLAPGGTFYLNYDDGHFRIAFDVDELRVWPRQLRLLAHNLGARLGRRRGYQRRVTRGEAERLVVDAGFACVAAWYGNVDRLKAIAPTVPAGQRDAFHDFWITVEERLDAFAVDGRTLRGDPCNLWTTMGSRTLLLRHAPSP